MTVSIASSKMAVAPRATIAIRGTITSWSRRSPSSMTALIICSSSASRIPCSPPRSTISRSSSAVICASVVTSAPNSRVTQRVIAVSSATTGPSSRARKSTGRDSTSANRSALASASVFGHELGEHDREQREDHRDDDERDDVRGPAVHAGARERRPPARPPG